MIITYLVGNTSWLESVVQLILVILIFIFVVFLAYLAARIAGSYQANVFNKQSNIKVIETYRITNNKFIQVVKIGDKYAAIGIGKDEVNLLMELNEDSITEINPQLAAKIDFKDVLAKVKNKKLNKNDKE